VVASRRRAVLVLALAVGGISVAAPLIRLSDAHPLAIAIWRLAFALLVILVFLARSRGWEQWARLGRADLGLAAVAGVMLALHFWAWNTSIDLTTIAASVVLVNLQPLLVALFSALWLRESPTHMQWSGIGVALLGAIVIPLAGSASALPGSNPVLGNALALIGAVTAAAYYLAGRRLRQKLDLWAYVTLVYGTALATLLLIAAAGAVPVLGQPPKELIIFAGLALGPMLLGHTGFNWALRYLPAYVVSLAVLGEPVGATLLAALLPGIREIPPPLVIAGGVLVLIGIALALPRSTVSEERVSST
jgi:drug/metabolite transporter (DMT)-like permease